MLIATQQDPKVVELARGYLYGLSGAVLPVLWFSVFRNFVAVLSQTVSILVISIISVLMGLAVVGINAARESGDAQAVRTEIQFIRAGIDKFNNSKKSGNAQLAVLMLFCPIFSTKIM